MIHDLFSLKNEVALHRVPKTTNSWTGESAYLDNVHSDNGESSIMKISQTSIYLNLLKAY